MYFNYLWEVAVGCTMKWSVTIGVSSSNGLQVLFQDILYHILLPVLTSPQDLSFRCGCNSKVHLLQVY